jgi:hypothetical protein
MATLYLHEVVETVAGNEERYMTSVLASSEQARWLGPNPPARDDKRPIELGQYRTAEASGRWPKVINIWRDTTWEQFVDAWVLQFASDNKQLEDWWQRNLTLRSQGYDRVLIAAPYSPSIDEHMARRTQARAVMHMIDYCRFGEAQNYIDRMGSDFLPAAAKHGWGIIGAFRVAYRPRQVLSMWGLRDWSAAGAVLSGSDPAIQAWSAYRESVVEQCEEMVLMPGRVGPQYLRGE